MSDLLIKEEARQSSLSYIVPRNLIRNFSELELASFDLGTVIVNICRFMNSWFA